MFASNWIFCKYNSEHIRESIIHLQTYYLNWIKLWNPIEERNTSRTKMSLFLCLSFSTLLRRNAFSIQVKSSKDWIGNIFLFFCCKIRVQVTPWLRKSIFSSFLFSFGHFQLPKIFSSEVLQLTKEGVRACNGLTSLTGAVYNDWWRGQQTYYRSRIGYS